MTSLLKRLENYLEENPRKYNKSCIERVRKLIVYETERSENTKPYRFLKKIEDFILYFNSHKEWRGYSGWDAQKDKKSGANAFYNAFMSWIYEQTTDKEERSRLRQQIFKSKNRMWSDFNRLTDWKEEFNRHPEWKGYSVGDAQKDKKSGAYKYYVAFNVWVCKQTKDKEKRKRITRYFFSSERKNWSSFKKISDWKEEFNRHPEWKGYSVGDAQKDKKSGANAYYQAFREWLSCKIKDKNERNRLIKKIFRLKNNYWSDFKTINDWKEEFNRHPEWKGYSPSDAYKDKEAEAHKYYEAFSKWVNKKTRDKEKKKIILQEIFILKNKPKIKTSSQLVHIINTEPKARYAVENAVRFSNPKEIDVTVADVLSVIWDGMIERKEIIKMLQEPNLAAYLGRFIKNNKGLRELPDFIDAAKALLPYDKNDMISRLIKRRVETWLYDQELGAKPKREEIYSALEKITEQINKLK